MKYYKLALIVLLSLSSSIALAVDLKQVFNDALKNDPKYKATLAENNALMEDKSIARSLVLPNLNLNANVTDNDNEITASGLTTTEKYKSNGYTLSLTQTIYNHDYFTQLSQADDTVAIAKSNIIGAKQELILRVATKYYGVLGAADNLNFAVAEKKSIKQQLRQTKQRFDVGLTAITDVHEAQSRYDQSVASEIDASNQLAINKEKLREITTVLYPTLKGLKEKTPLLNPEPANAESWIKTALDKNITLFTTSKSMSISRQEISRAQAGHYPSLDLVATRNHLDNTDRNTNLNTGSIGLISDSTSISLQLKLALYEGGRTSSKSQKAHYAYQQARQLYELQRRQIERETRTSYLTVIADISQVKALKQALASSKVALKATQAGFEVGTRTAVDVLNSQRELFKAQRNYAQSRYEYILETLRLRLAAGTLMESDINNINAWLIN